MAKAGGALTSVFQGAAVERPNAAREFSHRHDEQVDERPMVQRGVRSLPRHVWIVVAAYMVLGSIYASVTPIFEKPDEQWHFAFAMYVADTGRLPVQRLEGRDHLAEQEGSQPPLYYAVLAGLLKVVGLDNLDAGYRQLTEENPYYGGRPGAWLDNANRFIHGPCEYECRRAATAVYLGRGLSLLAGVVGLLAAATAIRLAFPGQSWLLLLVVGAIGFNPQFLHISSSVSNDAFLVATTNVAFALALWWWHRPEALWRAAAVGLAVGMALLTKSSGLSLIPTIGLLLLLGGRLAWPLRLRHIAIFGVVVALVSGWWFARNLLLYGEPTATQIHLQIFDEAPPPFTISKVMDNWSMVANSFWASFGWGGLNLSHEVYRAVRGFALLLVLAFVWATVRGRRAWSEPQKVLVGLSVVHLLVVGALLFQWMRLTEAPHGRLLFPALLPITLVLMLGFLRLVPQGLHTLASTTYPGAWAVVALVLAVTFIRPVYLPAPILAALPESAVPLGVRFGDNIVLEGYEAPPEPLAPGALVPITLYWRALEPVEEQFSVSVKLFGRDGQLIAQDDSYPDAGRRPTTNWPAGALIVDRKSVLVSEQTMTPTIARVTADVFRLETLERLPAARDGQPVIALPAHLFDVVVREEGATAAPAADLSYRPAVQEVRIEEGVVTASFAWEVGQPLGGDYHALFHLAPSPDQPPIAQGDFEPLGGDFPTSHWWPGDHLPDEASLTLPTNVAEGEYVLLLGLYDLATEQRVAGEGGNTTWTIARLRWDGESWGSIE
jgi:hypothetical protein